MFISMVRPITMTHIISYHPTQCLILFYTRCLQLRITLWETIRLDRCARLLSFALFIWSIASTWFGLYLIWIRYVWWL